MIKKLLFVLSLSFALTAKSDTTYFGDFPKLDIKHSDKFVFTVSEEFREKEHQGFFYEHSDFQIKYLINKHFDVFTDYRLIFQESKINAGYQNQNLFFVGFDVKSSDYKWGKVSLRERLEINTTTETYYLNTYPKYNTPWKFTKFQFNPFIGDESFWNTEKNMEFVKNRLCGGLDWQISKHIKCSTYAYHESAETSKRNGGWIQSNVAVQSISFDF